MLSIALRNAAAATLAFALPATTALAQASGEGAPPAVPVTVVTVVQQDVTLTATLPGRVVASAIAEVRPQVNGIIVERLYNEGADVSVGDPLYRIDSATYEARLAAADAQVAQAEAQLRGAEQEALRARELADRRVGSSQSLDDAVASRDMAAAAVEVAKADRISAVINLDRATIRAPLTGVIGRSLTTQGALVTDGQAQPLATIRAIDPVLVDVTQSAAEIIAWKRGKTRERLQGAEETVSLTLADGETYEETGTLRAAEPYVNEQTGVVTLRLTFPNPDRLLLPGMYVQVEMPQGIARDVVLAPQEGVSRDRRGRPVALVVSSAGVVEERILTIIEARGAHWVVSDGLADGDKVIVEGLQKVRPGVNAAPEERIASLVDASSSDDASIDTSAPAN